MIRRLFFWESVLLGLLLLLGAGTVRAQSCTGYSASITSAALAPGDVAARGGVTATETIYSNGSSDVPSHVKVVTPGTSVGFTWSSNNAALVDWYYTVDSDPTHHGESGWNTSFNGTDGPGYLWKMGTWDIGHTYYAVFVAKDANGNTTQDRNSVTTVAGSGPSIVSQDELPTNAYTEVAINFGGGSMMNNCSICQLHPNECIGKTHTPYVSLSATNHTSGESQIISRQIAGNQANESQSVSGKGSIWISTLPGDTVDGTANAEIFCTMFGDLPVSGNDDWGLDWELAWTKFSTIQSSCLPAGGNPPSIGCKVTSKYMCNTNSQPADLQVNQVFAEFDTNGNPVTLETVPPFWWGWGFGIRGKVAGFTTPWIFPANVLQQYKVGDMSSFAHVVLEIAAGAFPSNSTIRNCTNKDKGTSPETFPPLDQP